MWRKQMISSVVPAYTVCPFMNGSPRHSAHCHLSLILQQVYA